MPELTVKTLKSEVFKVTVDDGALVSTLAEKIKEKRPDMDASSMKLIFQGKILAHDKKVEEYNVPETGFIVVTASAKPRATEAPAAPAPQLAPAPAPAPTAAPAPAAAPAASAAPAADPQRENLVTQICAMGFERDHVVRALDSSFGNPDRAIEYLMNGIPPPAAEPAAPPANAGPSTAAFPAMPSAGGGSNAAPGMNLPADMQGPEAGALLAQLAQSHPELLALAQQGIEPEQLLALLQQEFGEGGPDMDDLEGLDNLEDMEGIEADGPHVELTEAEQSAVARIAALGFDPNDALQAYMACDKNEDIAANFLFEHMGD